MKTLKTVKLLNKFRCFGAKSTKQETIEAHSTFIHLDTFKSSARFHGSAVCIDVLIDVKPIEMLKHAKKIILIS